MTMRVSLVLLAIAPVAAHAADSTQTFRLVQDPANMASCLRLAPQFEREHTLTVSGDTVRVTAGGGLSEQMKPVRPNIYEAVLEMSGERLDYVADLGAKTFSVKGNNLGCKWSARLQ
jgi:hypothetical protein